jgi:hypothetical protein
MEIFKDNHFNYYVDQDLFDHINNIWLTFDQPIPDNSNILFLKNTTVPRLVTDYCNKNISRVIKKEKASHCIIKKIDLDSYPRYYDRVANAISNDDTKQVVYSINRLHAEDIDTIKQIAWFAIAGQNINYVNQDLLNQSLNNGFIIDEENYTIIKELVDSDFSDNHSLAYNMLKNSDLAANLDWILYIYHQKKSRLLDYDNNNSHIRNFILNKFNIELSTTLNSFDGSMKQIQNSNVKEKMIQYKKNQFSIYIDKYFKDMLKTELFDLADFQIKLKDEQIINAS